MKIAYMPARGVGGHLIDALSGFGGFCHCELVFSDGLCFSSTLETGTRFARLDLAGWTVEDVPMSDEAEAAVRLWCASELGCKYDVLGVARFTIPFLRQSADRWFCSEVCLAGLQQVGFCVGLDAWRISPNALRALHK